MSILINRSTAVVVQGITGREASLMVKDGLDYGAGIVAGVTPGKGGQTIYGIPVYDSMSAAQRRHQLDASIISVPPLGVKDAAFEAIESGIPLLVIITERVPRRDVSKILIFAEERSVRVIGPNSLGIICPGETKLGGIGGSLQNTLRTFTRGPVGVVSRSGGMTSEIANLLSQQGIGQSTCVSTGGDPLIGSTFIDLFQLFQRDPETRLVLLFCEPGGKMEEDFAEFYAAQPSPKPVVAFVAGRFVDDLPGRRFGHAAVIVDGNCGTTRRKIETLREASVRIADKLSDLPALVKKALLYGHVH